MHCMHGLIGDMFVWKYLRRDGCDSTIAIRNRIESVKIWFVIAYMSHFVWEIRKKKEMEDDDCRG